MFFAGNKIEPSRLTSSRGSLMSETVPQNDEQKTEPATKPVTFAEAAEEQQPSLLVEFCEFLLESKKWWLTPIIVALMLIGLVIALSSSVVAPFIYPIF